MLNRASLERLTGEKSVSQLFELAERRCAIITGDHLPRRRLEVCYMFARSYAPSARPWFPLHEDRADLTVNVTLGEAVTTQGGHLLGLFKGKIRRMSREMGEATTHTPAPRHGVSRLSAGKRHSLILFFNEALDRDTSPGREPRLNMSNIVL